jgi:molybdopterin converting factor small subunit
MYETLLKRAAGVRSDSVELDAGAEVRDVIRLCAERHGDPLRSLLMDGRGVIRPSLLIFVHGLQLGPEDTGPLSDGDVVTLMSPISGG